MVLGDQFLQKNSQGMGGIRGPHRLLVLKAVKKCRSFLSTADSTERSCGGLPDITALIDPEQFNLITKEHSGVAIIQGGAGTGKTTIALHRIAYLHFQNKQRFAPHNCLVIAPGEALKRYVKSLYPV